MLFNWVVHGGKQYRRQTGLLYPDDFFQNRFGIRIFWCTAVFLAFASKSCYILAKPVLTAGIEDGFQYSSCFSLLPSRMCQRLCFLFYFDALCVCDVTHCPPFYSPLLRFPGLPSYSAPVVAYLSLCFPRCSLWCSSKFLKIESSALYDNILSFRANKSFRIRDLGLNLSFNFFWLTPCWWWSNSSPLGTFWEIAVWTHRSGVAGERDFLRKGFPGLEDDNRVWGSRRITCFFLVFQCNLPCSIIL